MYVIKVNDYISINYHFLFTFATNGPYKDL